MDRTFVSQIERGVRQPTLTSLYALAKAVGTAPSKLLAQVSRILGDDA
jgi:transcriptional regulator with XRE-family HTH domain